MARFDKLFNVFVSYSHHDEDLCVELLMHLKALEREGAVGVWYDRKIGAGAKWEDEIDENLDSAEIILMLVSAYFIASDYCIGKEMARALERHENGEAIVIPIILRPADWLHLQLARLQSLPRDNKAVVSSHWKHKDEAWVEVAEGVRGEVESLRERMTADASLAMDVYVFRNGDDRAWMEWREVERYDPNGEYLFEEGKWRELKQAMEALKLNPQDAEDRLPLEIFFCSRGDLLTKRVNRFWLQSLLKMARAHAGASSLFLAVDDKISQASNSINNPDGLYKWLSVALRFKVNDLVEVGFNRKSKEPVDGDLLRAAADRSAARRDNLMKLFGADGWMCYFPLEPTLLNRYRRPKSELKQAAELMVVLDKVARDDRKDFVIFAQKEYSPAKPVIVLCEQADKELTQHCSDAELEIIQFRGTLELLFFLMWLETLSARQSIETGSSVQQSGFAG